MLIASLTLNALSQQLLRPLEPSLLPVFPCYQRPVLALSRIVCQHVRDRIGDLGISERIKIKVGLDTAVLIVSSQPGWTSRQNVATLKAYGRNRELTLDRR